MYAAVRARARAILRGMRLRGLCEALCLAGLLALAGCGEGGGVIITPDDPDEPGSGCSSAGTCGSVWVSLAEVGAGDGVSGEFLSYSVDVVSIRLERASGGTVELLPERQRVDFAGLSGVARLVAHGGLRERADGEDCAGQLVLRQRKQEVRLVLLRIGAALQQPAAFRRSLHPRVVSRRDVPGAERWLDRFLRSEPDSSWSRSVAARTYRALGQKDRALAAYQRALALAPEDIGTLRALSDFYGEEENKEEQLKLLPKHALLVDVAAPPGTIDREAAAELGLKAVWARGMGARAPITVGRSQWSGISRRIEGILEQK